MKSIILLMSDSYGIYIPQNFIRDIDRDAWHVSPDDNGQIYYSIGD